MKIIAPLSILILSASTFACNSAPSAVEPTNLKVEESKTSNVNDPIEKVEVEESALDIEVSSEVIEDENIPSLEEAVEEIIPENNTKSKTVESTETKNEKLAEPSFSAPTGITHSIFDEILKKYVNNQGFVDYASLKKNQVQLVKYLEMLSKTNPSTLSRNEGLAFWSNAYNAFTLKLMIDHYPLKSITDLKFDGKSAWDYVWININGKKYSLNQIENDILRPKYKEPRIHFIINCASFSCPILLNKALTAENIESIMTKQARNFINDPKRNKISAKSVQVSKLFDWYGKDFGNLRVFLNKYSETQIQEGAKMGYMDYDWSLNKQ